jgi:hypothetical protein
MKIKIGRTGAILGLSLFILNFFDGIATITLLASGAAYELNPLMNPLLNKMGIWFLFPKTIFGVIAGIGVAIWWTYRAKIQRLDIKVLRIFVIGIITAYCIVDLYQVILLCLI